MLIPWCCRPPARISLVCFPHSGGTAAVFSRWPECFPPRIEVLAFEYAGHGRRIREPLPSTARAVVEDLAPALGELHNRPFALFGHSMGALLAFEMCRLLRERRARMPVHLFVSAARSPALAQDGAIHTLPEPEFLTHLRHLGGTPEEVFRSPELMAMTSRIVRADLELCARYRCDLGEPLSLPVTVFGGDSDPEMPLARLAAWRHLTSAPWVLKLFRGGHFYIHSQLPELSRAIAAALADPAIYGD